MLDVEIQDGKLYRIVFGMEVAVCSSHGPRLLVLTAPNLNGIVTLTESVVRLFRDLGMPVPGASRISDRRTHLTLERRYSAYRQ